VSMTGCGIGYEKSTTGKRRQGFPPKNGRKVTKWGGKKNQKRGSYPTKSHKSGSEREIKRRGGGGTEKKATSKKPKKNPFRWIKNRRKYAQNPHPRYCHKHHQTGEDHPPCHRQVRVSKSRLAERGEQQGNNGDSRIALSSAD